jgi:hypothetical protein
MALTIFKLEKFTIEGFDTADRTGIAPKFEAQFNPTHIRWNYGISWSRGRTVNSSGQQQNYEFTQAPELSVTLTVDGTDVDSMGLLGFTSSSVEERVKQFKQVAYDYRGDQHEPPYLRVSWGSQETFDCRLYSFSVNFTLFDRDGTPLRAEISARFISDILAAKLAKLQQKSSPDLTHARVVRHGDTLPLLTKSVYGSSERYLDVAHYNGLDDFRKLIPGQELLFPPLAVLGEKSGSSGSKGNS